jgi:hypothetical protein
MCHWMRFAAHVKTWKRSCSHANCHFLHSIGAVTVAKADRVRWAVLISALAATIVAIFYPSESDEVAIVPAAEISRTPPSKLQKAGTAADITQAPLDWVANTEDPFASRGWEAAPPAPEVARTVQTVEVAEAPPPPPPPIPYAFVGQMTDGATA